MCYSSKTQIFSPTKHSLREPNMLCNCNLQEREREKKKAFYLLESQAMWRINQYSAHKGQLRADFSVEVDDHHPRDVASPYAYFM